MIVLTICLSLILWASVRYKQLQQINSLSGDNITHLLFHNLVKVGKIKNPYGIVGSKSINLPMALYKLTAKIFSLHVVGSKSYVASLNLIVIFFFEVIIFMSLFFYYGDLIKALYTTLAFSFLPTFSWISKSERASYVKFSERLPAAISNGIFLIFLFDVIYFGNIQNSFLISIAFALSIYLGKFSRQVSILGFLLFLLLSFNIYYFFSILMASFFLSFSSSIKEEIKSQLIYLKTYKSYQSNNFYISQERLESYNVPKFFSSSKIFRTYARLFFHSGVGIIIICPSLFFLIYQGDESTRILSICFLFISLLTTTHILYFIGPGYRYLYNLIPILVIPSMFNPDIDYLYLMYFNAILILISYIYNKNLISQTILNSEEKIASFSEFGKYIKSNTTIFFDHYKDGEIYQLIHFKSKKNLVSTTRDYSWSESCKIIFSSYPLIDLSESKLKQFNVDYIITCRNDLLLNNFIKEAMHNKYFLYKKINKL